MKKKVLIFMMVGTLAFLSFVSCGKTKTEDTSKEQTTKEATTAQDISGSIKKVSSVNELLESEDFITAMDASKASLGEGVNMEFSAEDEKTLVITYTYTDKEVVDKLLENKAQLDTMYLPQADGLAMQFKESIAVDELTVIIVLVDNNGQEIGKFEGKA